MKLVGKNLSVIGARVFWGMKVFFWGFLKEDLFLFSLKKFSKNFIFHIFMGHRLTMCTHQMITMKSILSRVYDLLVYNTQQTDHRIGLILNKQTYK